MKMQPWQRQEEEATEYKRLLLEFLNEYPEYQEYATYHDDGESSIDWTCFRVFLLWLKRNGYITDAMLDRGNKLLHGLRDNDA